MKYLDFREKLKKYVAFSLSDVRAFDPEFRRRQLNEWQDHGYIKKVRRGYYMFSDIKLNETLLFALSNKIYPHSYVSLESALSWYGLIPEGVFAVTAVSSKNTTSFQTSSGYFSYRHIKTSLFNGYKINNGTNGVRYKIASPEKTVLDYLYFHPEMIDKDDFDGWRFNSVEFLEQADLDVLQKYAKKYPKSVQERLKKLLVFIKNENHA